MLYFLISATQWLGNTRISPSYFHAGVAGNHRHTTHRKHIDIDSESTAFDLC